MTTTDACGGGRYVVHVVDVVDERIAGHRGGEYTSPPQPEYDAHVLVGLLLGTVPARSGERWTQAVPGGHRTVSLVRADDARRRWSRAADQQLSDAPATAR